MAQRRTSSKRKSPTKRKPRTRKVDHTLNWVGCGLFVVAALAFFKLGIIGTFLANCFRLVIGDAYLVGAALVVLYGAWLIVSGKALRPTARLSWGAGLITLGGLGVMSGRAMAAQSVHAHFFLATWRLLQGDFALQATTSRVGGGLIGAGLLNLFAPLLAEIGAMILFWVLILIGVAALAGVKPAQVFAAGHWLAAKLSEAVAGLRNQFDQGRDLRTAKHTAKKEATEAASKPAHMNAATEPAPQSSTEPAKDLPKPVAERQQEIKINVPHSEAAQTELLADEKSKAADAEQPLDTSASAGDDYVLPAMSLLTPIPATDQSAETAKIRKNSVKLSETLQSFGVDVTVKQATLGPSITQYEIQPATGVKVSKITNLADDLALALAAKDIRIEAPIPGKSLIGIEVPNQQVATVGFREVLEKTPAHPGKPLVIPLGKDVDGHVKTFDLTKMPHLLIAGATGSGKSVMINVIITSILMTTKPDQVRLMLIDPKKVELSVYDGVPHLLTPVVTEAKKAPSALNKVVKEMENRYERFAAAGVRNIGEYNQKAKAEHDPDVPHLPLIVVIVDELSDLMMVAGSEVETALVRLGQMARAAGIHVIIATQRPSVDVITGLIKANFPSRLAFAVSSGVDSRTILDMNGAEKLLGRGDMLFAPIDAAKPMRIQGAYISSEDVEAVVKSITDQVAPEYVEDMTPSDEPEEAAAGDSEDELYDEAKAFVIQQQTASTSLLQRRFRIGYNRAARLIDDLEANHIVGPSEGSKPRKVFVQPGQSQDES
ncbi:DNA translocase FtsK [Lacticaseibacillus camelliae]|uniref:DNA translocase FtsK n=1 Tax=Lacticaseibacillus camelliae DSM 22697 = JCM 13995 TaxID=1423730 RepID=A0A0R2EWB5_9LACO|nr:DNA translocase FtsK [Lacticaseibacillus camelliae]KRN20744.1 FtsK SpoIIIE family DNA translocase [Lacticaseibacillus camelliae DSM 22697 = JCM 13995]